ncbi:hypothetical protein [Streptomyces sp. B1I3]|uniref:hypothetical protein n=1 Tax=Streptomyces sp. B1I3 TaxID=3042264 RepID=UPI0027823780|nr:hypothetical protein [Streptomyces sp. B1I3]MDQ0794911.1 hypothetical protein [Streptomyces sp. B1I3]
MSDSDQQYPYPYDPRYGHEGQSHPQQGQPYGQQGQSHPQQGQPYGQQGQPHPQQGQQYGQPHPQQGQQYPQHSQPYGQQGQPYPQQGQPFGAGDRPSPSYDAHAAPYAGTPDPVAWPEGQATQQPAAHAPQGHAQGAPDPGATQTWQGQTWDTRYQPAIQPQQAAYRPVDEPQQQGRPDQQAVYRPAPQPDPVQGGAPATYPLPPEAPGTPGTPDAPAAQAGQGAQAARAGAADDSGYSAPTTLGNSRITDAQRARAEGRSPIIAPGMQPAAVTAGLGLLLALGSAIGPYALLVPLVLLQAVTAAGWFRLNGMWPARQGIALAFAGGFVADAVLLVAGRDNAPAAILGTLGVWVLLTLVLQLRSHAGADERMYGLTATVASAALAVLAAGHLAAVPDAVTVGGIAVAVAVLVRALPLPGPVSVVVALLASAGAGALAGGFTDFGAQAAFLGFAAGGCALIGLRVASYDYPSRFVHMTAGVALPLTAAAPAVYLIGRALA